MAVKHPSIVRGCRMGPWTERGWTSELFASCSATDLLGDQRVLAPLCLSFLVWELGVGLRPCSPAPVPQYSILQSSG